MGTHPFQGDPEKAGMGLFDALLPRDYQDGKVIRQPKAS
jgi:hypothetical protein